jgi:hypothetical protein
VPFYVAWLSVQGLLVVGLRLLTVGDIGGVSGGGDDLLEDRRRQRSKVRMPRTPNQRGGGSGGHSGASNDKLEASVKKSQGKHKILINNNNSLQWCI